MNRGALISGAGHVLLIVGLIIGDWLGDWTSFDSHQPEVADVAIISEQEYTELALPRPPSPPLADIPDSLAKQSDDAEVPVPEVGESPAAVETPEPITPDEMEASPEVPVVSEPVAPEPFDAPPIDISVPEPVVPPSLDAPPVEDTPTPQDAPRIAPDPVPESPPSPEISDIPTPAVSPDSESNDAVPDLPEAAPEEATTEIVTEAETPSPPLEVSSIPRVRPTRSPDPEPEPKPEPAAAPEPEPGPPEDRPAIDFSDAVERAVGEANVGSDPEAAPSPVTAPTLSQDEIQRLRVAIRQCWNVGAVSSEALLVTVTVGITMTPDGRPGEPRLLGHTGGSDAAAAQAFDAARRAILRCGSEGYNLPTERYEQWREIEITFNPEKMRLK